MEVHYDHLAFHRRQQRVSLAEGIVSILHEDAPLQVYYGETLPVSRLALVEPDSGHPLGVIGRTQHFLHASPGVAVGGIEVFHDLPLIPYVITGCEHATAQIKQLVSDCGCEAKAARGVFGIGDYQIDLVRLNQVREVIAHNFASRAAENVTDEENLHEF